MSTSKSDRESLSNSSSTTPKIEDLEAYDTALRVFEELGSRKACEPLIDANKTPKLVLENEVKLRLHDINAKEKDCKVYIFSDYFLVGSKRLRKRLPENEKGGMDESTGMTTASSSQDAMIFGSNKASDDSSSKDGALNEGYDSDTSYYNANIEAMRKEELERVKKQRKYNLKMWVDLARVKLSIHRKKGKYGIKIIYTTKTEVLVGAGEVKYNTTVDQTELWFENMTLAKTICGLIQEQVDKNSIETLKSIKKLMQQEDERQKSTVTSGSDTDTTPIEENSKKSSVSSNTGKRRRRGRANLKRGLLALKATETYLNMSEEERLRAPAVALTAKDIAEKYRTFIQPVVSTESGVAEDDEGKEAIFTVVFKKKELGIALSDKKAFGPFVRRVEANGMAEMSGVTLGDRIIAVNDVEITPNHSFKDCISVIKSERKKNQQLLTITFQRKQSHEIQRIRKNEELRQAIKEAKDKEKEEKLLEEAEVIPVPDAAFINKQKTLKGELKNVRMKKVTEKGPGNYPRYTLVKTKSKTRKFKRKMELMKTMQHTITNIHEFKEYKKNKARIFDLYQQMEELFNTVPKYLDSKEEKTCFYALKEIYDTECAYNTQLNALRGLQVALLTARKNVICKNLKSGKPFCEHRRPKRFCSQESSTREEAVDHKEVNSIFLNLKPIIKSNQYLFRNLQSKLGELHAQAAKGQKIQIYQMVEVYSETFAEIAPFLKIYWQYCKRYISACQKQKKLRESNTYFYDIVRPVEKELGMKLPNLLSRPVQRITKYTLLFGTLKKYVAKFQNHINMNGSNSLRNKMKATTQKLETACIELLALTTKVNTSVGVSQNLDKMNEAYLDIGGKDKIPNLLAPWRRLEVDKEECDFEHSGIRNVVPNCVLYVFNDKIAVAQQVSTVAVNPVATGKGSYSLRAYRKIGVNTRPSSFTKKKTSIKSMASIPDEKRKSPKKKRSTPRLKKKSSFRSTLRLSNHRAKKSVPSNVTGKTTTTRLSISSQGSKNENTEYDVLTHFSLKRVSEVNGRKKQVDNVDYFAVDIRYTKKNFKDKTDTAKCILWFKDAGMRKKLIGQINSLREQDRKHREENRKNRERIHAEQRQSHNKKKGSVSRQIPKKSSL